MCHDDATQRARQVRHGKEAKPLQLGHEIGCARREEQVPNGLREVDEDHEIVELEGTAKGGKNQGFRVAAAQRPVVDDSVIEGCAHGW